jgi:hypothetical protein
VHRHPAGDAHEATPTEVLPTLLVRTPAAALSAAPVVPFAAAAPSVVPGPRTPAVASSVRPSVLPFTGGELAWFLPAGLVSLALGAALLGMGRTRETELAC